MEEKSGKVIDGNQSIKLQPYKTEISQRKLPEIRVLAQSYERDANSIPFHIPHKRLFEKMKHKKTARPPPPEPLAGFSAARKRFATRKQNQRDDLLSQASSSSLRPQTIRQSTSEESFYKFRQETAKILPHQQIPNVMDQQFWIDHMRQRKDQSFIYMTYAVPTTSELFTPYALKVVEYSQVNPKNFYSMSNEGVLQHCDFDIIFTPLNQWEYEYKLYAKLMRLKIFFKYRLWRTFNLWRKIIIFKKFNNAQLYLNNNLFILNDDLCKCLLVIQEICYNLSDIILIDDQIIEDTSIFYFIDNQMRQLDMILIKIQEQYESIRDTVLKACYQTLTSQGFVVNELTNKSKRKEMKSSYIEQAAKRRYCQRLCSFIILIDYIIIDLLHKIIINSTNKLKHILLKHLQYLPEDEFINNCEYNDNIEGNRREFDDKSPKLPLFAVDIVIINDGIDINPSIDVICDLFEQVVNLWDERMKNIKALINDNTYKSFTNPIINGKELEERICSNGPTLQFYLNNDTSLQQERQSIINNIIDNYNVVRIYLNKLQFIHQFHKENLQTVEEQIYNEFNVENLRNLCLRYYQEIEIIDNLCEEQSLGIFLLKTDIFKETIKPETKRLIGYTERNLAQIGKMKTQELIEESKDMQVNLVRKPLKIEEWVHYLEYIENANEKLLKIEEILEYTQKIYDLIEEFHINVDGDNRNDYLNVCEIIQNIRQLIDEKLEKYSELIDKFNEELNMNLVELFDEITMIKDECLQEWLLDVDANVDQVTEFLNELLEKLLNCQKRANEFKNYQKQFKLEVSRFDQLDEVMNDIKLRQLLWECSTTWGKMEDQWYNCDFNTINVDDLTQFIAKYVKNCVVLEKGLPKNLIVPKLRNDVESMKNKLPVIGYLRNPSLKPRHWMQIENMLNHHFKPDEILTLNKFENLEIMNYEDELLEISKQASSESNLEQLLKKVEDLWKNLEFQILPYKDYKDVFILGSLEEIQTVLDDSSININTIASSRYVGPIKTRVDDWIEMLNTFSKTLDEWVACQQTWLYLEVIFSAPDIQRQLPHESKLFQVVDKSWKNIMRRTANLPLAMNACLSHNLLEELQQNNQLLEQILKCLETYLEIKRVQFPRFYFLSNDELLEILAQTKNPFTIQQYLKKCFDAITKLEFGYDVKKQMATTDILAMISPEGEHVEFVNKNLKARGNVEDWLLKVEISMFQTLKRLMKHGLNDFLCCEKRTDWLQKHPNQIVLCVSQIIWAKNVHLILDSKGERLKLLEDFEKKSIEDLNDLAILVRDDLAPILRKILIALITIDVHARDIISNLITKKIDSSTNFEWLKVLRYYWNDTVDDCIVKMSSTTYNYGYEYLGASGVLVITPLTDKCYLCLMGALQLDLGGAPAGPAGTGKTETTKDLAKALAIQCVVFNCSDTLDYKMMSRFFYGLVQCGGWCCFDEFNRIDLEVLSVIAQQILTIRNAKVAKLSRFWFEGREIKLVQRCAVFITMNPGYAGRTELPDNLKALFRPISMMVPDYALIAEVILYSEGFQSSKVLAQKMVQMYKLCSEQLSQQDHYDFGMRAVKSVLVMAGTLKRSNPDVDEDVVLISALRDSNLPKFLADDVLLFQGILGDLFPGVELPERNYGDFQDVINKMMIDNNLQPTEKMIKKVLQLYETMIVRWGVMLVGPTGGGKSTIIKILNHTLTHMNEEGYVGEYYQPVHTYILNPKAISCGELYGEIDRLTLEWRDGLMGIVMRLAVNYMNSDEHKDSERDHQWIICDGPVDAVWIENLNTVLDDNKMLCLANSERIKLTPYVHMIFEVEDLVQASPATVSRCGMVYVDPNELKWLPYVQSWIQRITDRILNDQMKEYLLKLFEYSVEDGLDFVKKNCNYSIHQVDISKVTMLCAILESCLQLYKTKHFADIDTSNNFKIFLYHLFIFAYLWGIGGNLLDTSKMKFEVFVKQQFNNYRDIERPPPHNLWSIFINIETLTYQNWETILPTFQYNKNIPFFELLVPTVDTVRYGYLIELLLKIDYPILLVGETGVGKTVLTKSILNQLNDDATNKIYSIILNFSAQTTSLSTQEMLELKLERKKKTLLSAPGGKKMIVFIDDVNMPKLEKYGAQPPIELLRQYLDYSGFYDREKFYWKSVENMVICAACAPPGGGRNPLTPRFVRHFGMLLIPQQDETVLKSIFKVILEGFLVDFVDKIRNLSDHIVNAAIEVYQRIKTDLLPTPTKSHYVFNLRDLSKCIQGILQADSGRIREELTMLRLFYHECLRVFHDRLVNIEDKSYFYYLMQEICLRNFNNSIIELPTKQHGVIVKPPKLFFGDFLQFGASKENRCYEEIQNLDKMKNVLQDYLDDYNLSASKEMNLIFFIDAIEHCVRIARILRSERGNALLVGVSGMGKQSLTRLASHLNDYKCFQIELTGNYDHVSFFEDLRKITFNAGALNENTVFLFTDTQIIQEDFLEDINNLLNSGNIPNLFESDEYEKVIITTRDAAIQSGLDCSNRDMIFDYFLQRVRKNLHLVICMSPIGDAFRWRCRMFPSLVNCCTIDWFEKWPQEALLSVAQSSLRNVTDNNETTQKLARICVTIHEDVETMTEIFYKETKRYYYTTPSSYLELLKLYLLMLEKRRNEIQKTRDRILNGLKKIYETNELIDTMKETLIALEPELAKKSKIVAELMVNLQRETSAADRVREIVKHDEEIARIKADETQLLADDAQKDLDTVLPALEAATKALESLNRNDINEVKAFPKPPKLVEFVMESICILLGAKTDWASAKVVLADVNFLKKLQDYDKDRIPESALKKLKTYIEHPDFVPEKVVKVSKACKSMCIWVRAIDMYAKVFKVVEPKRKRLQEAEREFNQVMGVLKEKQRQLAEVEAQIATLEAKFNQTLAEKQGLEDELVLTSNRLNRAGRLNIALADEQQRWKQQVEEFTSKLANLLGDILLAAANVAYLGPFTSNYRKVLVNKWFTNCQNVQLSLSKEFNLINILIDQYTIRMWNSYGLPYDLISIENAIYVTNTSRWALMIDPQEQANNWIRQMELKNDLIITKFTDNDFLRNLELCLNLGRPVLLEEINETLDPVIETILLKRTFVQNGRQLIHFNDKDIEYDDNFKLYLTTKLSNPHYLPEIFIKVTIVNFTVTKSGLEDQLLAHVVRLERPDLETLRTELIVKINEDKNQLKSIEDKILFLLYNATGNILDDEELIDTLNESKETSSIIAARLLETQTTELQINEAREKYRCIAIRGSIIYFVIVQLAVIDPMYQYSLKYFSQIFNGVIKNTKKSPNLSIHLENLIKKITLTVYQNISRGLFARHKLIYSFMLCCQILQQQNEINDFQWNFLLKGSMSGQKTQITIRKPNDLITDQIWLSVNFLATNLSCFKQLPNDILGRISVKIGDFQEKIELIANTTRTSSIDWNALDDFNKLLLLKALKEEKLVFAINEFVKIKLGQEFIESPPVSLQLLFQDTSNTIPLIFILSQGSDPFTTFQRFSNEMNFTDRTQSISLGQGQGPIAEKLIEHGQQFGNWIFLQNCHLATSWMLTMERIILRIINNPQKIHNDFRLYMSSMPTRSFPISVLQNSIKVTNEPPKGVRANMKRAFAEIDQDFFEDHVLQQKWRSMLFGLCMFHTIIQERKKFGPLGWNIVYEFNDNDRDFAFNTLKIFCNNDDNQIPWDALEYLTGEIIYGGRVTDIWDLRCLKTILKIYFSPKIFQRNYQYSKSGIYFCPTFKDLQKFREFIDNFPSLEEPELFGMHENANITYQIKETQNILLTILDSQPLSNISSTSTDQEGGGDDDNNNNSSDNIVYNLADMICNRIQMSINMADYMNKDLFQRDYKQRLPSLTTVLMQEIVRYNKLLKLIHQTMQDLKKAIKGLVVMSESLEDVFKAFLNNQVPKLWSAKSYNSLKSLGSWVHDLILRLDFITIWLELGHPISYWLSGFYFPQGFLTGILQTHARKYNLPIDELKFDFIVQDAIIEQERIKQVHEKNHSDPPEIYQNLKRPQDGAIIHGLYLDGGRWDLRTKRLIDERPGEINPTMPAIWLLPKTERLHYDGHYVTPLYKTAVRAGVLSTTGHSTNFVLAILLKTDQLEDYWVLKGTALLTQITN